MQALITLLIFVGSVYVVDATKKVAGDKQDLAKCEYPSIDTGPKVYPHTMCSQTRSDDLVKSYDMASDSQEFLKVQILRKHNDLRGKVGGTDLQKMHWDDELARFAYAWAKTCPETQQDPNVHLYYSRYAVFAGQNTGSGIITTETPSQVVDEVLNGWSKVETDYRYEKMVFARTSLIGCALVKCNHNNGQTINLVCDYIDASEGWTKSLYTKGLQASACGSSFKDEGLCNCNKFCGNRGKMDLKTCMCICAREWQGEECTSKKPCKEPKCYESPQGCRNREALWSDTWCDQPDANDCVHKACRIQCIVGFGIDFRKRCPHLCAMCSGIRRPCLKPNCHASTNGCRFRGTQLAASNVKCQQPDPGSCANWGCTKCTDDNSVMTCPHKCARCPVQPSDDSE